MPVDDSAKGKTYPAYDYEVGKEKIREYAYAVGEDNPVYFDRQAAKDAGFRDIPRRRCSRSSTRPAPSGPRCSTRRWASTSR